MKKFTIILVALVISITANAQEPNYGENKDLCLEKVSLYSGYLKQKQYKDAYRFWKEAVQTCPEYKANLYSNGAYILKKLYKDKTIDEAKRKVYKDSIAKVYKAGLDIFGANPEMQEDYGSALIVYASDFENGVKNLQEAMESLKEKISYTTIVYFSQAMSSLIRKKTKDCEEGVKEYERLAEYISKNEGKKGFDKAQEAIDKYLGPCLTCDKLVPVLEKKWDKAKTDMELAGKLVDLLDKRGCTASDIFKDLLPKVIAAKTDPTARDYMRVAQLQLESQKKADAMKSIEKAIELAKEDEKEEVMEKAAKVALSSGSSSKAGKFASELLKINPNNGNAYLVKATLATRSGCGSTAFENATKYWVAYDLASKAKSVDPSVADQASKQMSSYRSRFPEKSELFVQGKTIGASYSHCSGATTTVRAK